MISIEMSPCQFNKVSEVIKNDHPEASLVFDESKANELNGHIHTSQIDADFEFRPRENNQGTLVFLNEQKHGMYKMISDDTIGTHLGKLLNGIVCDEQGETLLGVYKPPTTTPPVTGVNPFVKPPVQGTGN